MELIFMNESDRLAALSGDDLPTPLTQNDIALRQQLEQFASQRFYDACDRLTQTLLAHCEWQILLQEATPILAIACPDITTYWHIVNALDQMGDRLRYVTDQAIVRLYPPPGKGRVVEISLDAIDQDYSL
jgi:hypothetical protein